jgi:hypothetical protein
MESGRDEQLAYLQSLADELTTQGLTARLLTSARQPCVKVANAEVPELTERVLCHPADDGSWCFWWPWRQPIGSADDLATVSSKITTALRAVRDGS